MTQKIASFEKVMPLMLLDKYYFQKIHRSYFTAEDFTEA